MGEPGLVSIVVNNYNYARYLAEAIDSALNQTYAHVEVIVVDDGSTDESRDVIARYAERVTALMKENGGQASAISAGFAASRGDIVVFLDADDLLLPHAIETARAAFGEPDVVKVHWPLWEIDEAGAKLGSLKPRGPLADGDFRELVIREGPIAMVNAPTSGNAWARTFLDHVMPARGFGDGHGADSYLFTLAPLFGSVRAVAEPLGCYRVHSGSFSHRGTATALRRYLVRYGFHCENLRDHLERQGVHIDVAAWMGPHSPHAWMRDMLTVSDDIASLVPPGGTIVLVDEEQLGPEFIPLRTILPFPERDGCYAGVPDDDAEAIREVERLRLSGAEFVVFVRSTFWWLDYFTDFARHLRSRYHCVFDSSAALVFDLRRSTGA